MSVLSDILPEKEEGHTHTNYYTYVYLHVHIYCICKYMKLLDHVNLIRCTPRKRRRTHAYKLLYICIFARAHVLYLQVLEIIRSCQPYGIYSQKKKKDTRTHTIIHITYLHVHIYCICKYMKLLGCQPYRIILSDI